MPWGVGFGGALHGFSHGSVQRSSVRERVALDTWLRNRAPRLRRKRSDTPLWQSFAAAHCVDFVSPPRQAWPHQKHRCDCTHRQNRCGYNTFDGNFEHMTPAFSVSPRRVLREAQMSSVRAQTSSVRGQDEFCKSTGEFCKRLKWLFETLLDARESESNLGRQNEVF